MSFMFVKSLEIIQLLLICYILLNVNFWMKHLALIMYANFYIFLVIHLGCFCAQDEMRVRERDSRRNQLAKKLIFIHLNNLFFKRILYCIWDFYGLERLRNKKWFIKIVLLYFYFKFIILVNIYYLLLNPVELTNIPSKC